MWDERYREPGYAYGSEPNDFLASVADRIPQGPVLCLAEGEGRNGVFLASRGHAVTAVDGSAVGLEKARALAAERQVSLRTVHSDLAEYAIEPGAWAGIVSIWCHLPAALRVPVPRGVVEGLRRGGVVILEAYTPAQLTHGTGGPKVADLLYGLEQLKQDLAGLAFEHAVELERDILEGRYHAGQSAVVQILARKPG